jgi:short-subunit dehydrogenase
VAIASSPPCGVDSLADLQKEHGVRLVSPVLDLTDTAGIRAVLASTFRQLGRIDVLVSNAGYGLFGAAEEVTDAQIDHQISTNLIGSIQFIRAAIPHLRQQGGGRIVQVSSEGGQIAYPAFSLYHATKWSIEGLSNPPLRKSRPSESISLSSNPVLPPPISAPVWCTPRRPTSIKDTPAGAGRRSIAEGSFAVKGDAGRTVDAMISAADRAQPSLRLALGSTAYNSISHTLAKRLAAIEPQREVAFSADRDSD